MLFISLVHSIKIHSDHPHPQSSFYSWTHSDHPIHQIVSMHLSSLQKKLGIARKSYNFPEKILGFPGKFWLHSVKVCIGKAGKIISKDATS